MSRPFFVLSFISLSGNNRTPNGQPSKSRNREGQGQGQGQQDDMLSPMLEFTEEFFSDKDQTKGHGNERMGDQGTAVSIFYVELHYFVRFCIVLILHSLMNIFCPRNCFHFLVLYFPSFHVLFFYSFFRGIFIVPKSERDFINNEPQQNERKWEWKWK